MEGRLLRQGSQDRYEHCTLYDCVVLINVLEYPLKIFPSLVVWMV